MILVLITIAEASFKANNFQSLATPDLNKAIMDALSETDVFREFLESVGIPTLLQESQDTCRANKKFRFPN